MSKELIEEILTSIGLEKLKNEKEDSDSKKENSG